MPEIGTSGSTSGDGKRRVAAWPKRTRPSSTLLSRRPPPNVTTVVEPMVVRGYSHRAREIATDMAADVLSLVAAGHDLEFWRKDRVHAAKAASGALSRIAVRWGGP